MKVAGYGRVSTAGQAEAGTSLEDQKRIVAEKCQRDGHELYEFYADEGVSGGTLQRPALQRLIADAKEKRFEAVYFTKLDRMGRSVRDIHNLFHELHEENGIDMVCLDDPSLNTGGKMGAVMLGMLSTFAQFERAMIKERTMSGRRAKWDKGEIVIGELPLGYRKNETTHKPEIVDDQAAIYQKIVDLYLEQRLSMKDIANRLTKEHIPTPSAQKSKKIQSTRWNSITIGSILKQPCYKGEAIYNRRKYLPGKSGKRHDLVSKTQGKPEAEWIKIPFPPLISPDRWQQVQDRIETQRHKPKRIFKAYDQHFLLDGLLYCGECGSRMRKRVKEEKGGKVRLYYVCYWHGTTAKDAKMGGRKGPCNLKAVNADVVDQQLFDQVVDMLTRPDKYVEAWLKDLNADTLSAKVELLEKKERQLDHKLKEGFKYISSQTNPDLKKIYLGEHLKVQREWEAIQPELQKAKADFEAVHNKVDRYQQFKAAIAATPFMKRFGLKYKTTAAFKREMLALPFPDKRRVVEAIVSPENGGRCSIEYIRPIDFLSHEELMNVPEEKRRKPLEDKTTYVRGDFSIDLDKIESIIQGLKGKLLNKEDSDPLPRGEENARGWRRFF